MEEEFGVDDDAISLRVKLNWLREKLGEVRGVLFQDWRGKSLVAVFAVILVGLFVRKSLFGGRAEVDDELAALVVSMGEAGKAGDLVVTEAAMKLAEIDLAPAKVRQVDENFEVTGIIETGGNQLAKVTPQAPGKVAEILAFEGDDVKEGQVLALLESPDLARAQASYRQARAHLRVYEKNLERQKQLAGLGEFGSADLEESRTRSVDAASGLEEARRSVSEQKKGLVKAQSDLKVLENLVLQAEADFSVKLARLRRAESLPKVVSLQELERLRADTKIAESEVAMARARVVQGKANIVASEKSLEVANNLEPLAAQRWQISESARSREEKIFSRGYSKSRELIEAESSLELARVKLEGAKESVRLLGGRPGEGSGIALIAPISGKIQSSSLTLGETIHTDQVAFSLINLEHVWAELALAPRDLAKVKVGNKVELKADSSPGQVFVGHISSISGAADDITKTVSARMLVENPTAALKVGSFVSASVITDIRLERVTVPEGALQEHTGRPTIYVANPGEQGSFEVRHVILGEKGEGWREISDGLKPDEILATQGTFYLKSEAMKKSLSDGCCAAGE